MGVTDSARSLRRVYTSALYLSLPFAVIVLNSYVDQFFITLQGKYAVFAYTLALPIESMLLAVGSVIGAGVAVIIHRKIREGDLGGARSSAIEAVYYSVPVSVIITVALFFAYFCLRDFISDRQVISSLDDFLLPFFTFFLVTTVNAVICGVMGAQGMKRGYVTCLLMSLFFNVVFDQVFVIVFHLGVTGNALGTITGVTFSLVVGVILLTRRNVKVPLGIRYLSKERQGLANVLEIISLPLIRTFTRYTAEFVIRLFIFTTYALTYGVPVLYASVLGVLGSALSSALSFEFAVLYARRDADAAYSFFKFHLAVGFGIMLALAVFVSVFSPFFASIFTTHGTMKESQAMMEWTISVICFSAPFLGVRDMCASVYASTERRKLSLVQYVIWKCLHVAMFVVALQFSFETAMYFIVIERAVTSSIAVVLARRFVLRGYRTPSDDPAV